MAAPHVSGVAALILSRYPNISLPQLRSQILGTTVPVPALQAKTVTGGRVNAFNALNASADGRLELLVNPPAASELLAGSTVQLTVRVTDLTAVTNATVTGSIQGSTNLVFSNIGTGPDTTGNDSVYSAFLSVPAFTNAVALNLSVSAPGKLSTNSSVNYSIVAPPLNDDFAKRAVITGSNIVVTGSNVGATRQPGEPNHAGDIGGKSVWWSWTASSSGTVVLTTLGSDFDTLLAIYIGSSVSNLVQVASNDDADLNSLGVPSVSSFATFDAVEGSTYQIAVDGFAGLSGGIRLTLGLIGQQTAPLNNQFQNRFALIGSSIVRDAADTNAGATKEASEPDHAGNLGGKSVWYSWIAPFNGQATVTTSGSNFDTLLGVYVGSLVDALTEVVSSDDDASGGTTSRATFQAVAGVQYQCQLAGQTSQQFAGSDHPPTST